MALTRTSKGRHIDMQALAAKHQKTIAVTGGGVPMNARGDHLGPGGKVIRRKEDIDRAVQAYNESNAQSTKKVDIRAKNIAPDNVDKSLRNSSSISNNKEEETEILDLDDVSKILNSKSEEKKSENKNKRQNKEENSNSEESKTNKKVEKENDDSENKTDENSNRRGRKTVEEE